ncbi:MAG TPA: peptidoglycan-associated lipoprotein Pal [Nitrospiria bacterium]|nr:peptidoglycan-associated lipoprotein Pal [Nitrospiria bacterium]
MQHLKSGFAILPLLMTLAVLPACNREAATATVKSDVSSGHETTSPPEPPAYSSAVPKSPIQESVEASKPLDIGLSGRSFQDAFFDFDKYLIRNDAKEALQKDAEFLNNHPNLKVQIEGHCDDRGTEEYNLVLGNHRAEAVKQYLVTLGVDASRISIISYGKDKPFCSQHNASCYQDNRRGHFVSLNTGT